MNSTPVHARKGISPLPLLTCLIMFIAIIPSCGPEPFQDWDTETYHQMSREWGNYSDWQGQLQQSITQRTKLQLTRQYPRALKSDQLAEVTDPIIINPRTDEISPTDRTVEWYVQAALQRNPAITAAYEKVNRLKNIAPQAKSLDFPSAAFEAGELAETAAGQVEFRATVRQEIPFPGKLRARGLIALQNTSIAAAELERVRLQVIADVRRAYWRLFYSVRGIEVTEANYQLVDQFQRIAEARVRAGQTSTQDVLRAAVELGVLEEQLICFREQKRSATAMLNQLMNRSPYTSLPDPPSVEMSDFDLNMDLLLEEAQRYNPDIQAARATVGKFREELKLARLDNYPDFLLGFTYGPVRSNGPVADIRGKDQWWFTIGFTMPIWFKRIQGAKFEAYRGVREALASLRNANNVVAFRIIDSIANVEAQRDEVILFRDQILPQARQTVEASVSGYETGELDFLTLIDNWQQLLQFELIQYQNITELEQAFADLREAVGRDFNVAVSEQGLNTVDQIIDNEIHGQESGISKEEQVREEELLEGSPDIR